ncbi:hypothetical protein [Haladaptatus litoreus]|uniref:hypothetical protein n=1 Tax=Haladaptatus litoreus TaxID=553468 RepID=UPI00158B21F3|nr:hypothetical protein [Haladaptatus litoreus]
MLIANHDNKYRNRHRKPRSSPTDSFAHFVHSVIPRAVIGRAEDSSALPTRTPLD